MRIRSKLNRYILIAGVAVILATVVPGVMAFEGHTINVKAHVKGDTTATRTPGWWKNRPNAQQYVLDEYMDDGHPEGLYMGWPDAYITNVHQTMGIFWADQAKEIDCDGNVITPPTRDTLCKARAQASFQVLAAILSSLSPNGAALPVPLEDIQYIMHNGTADEVLELHNIMAAFNLSRDFKELTLCIPETYLGTVKNKVALEIAWEEFANCEVLVCP
jgi:hypothetical protein